MQAWLRQHKEALGFVSFLGCLRNAQLLSDRQMLVLLADLTQMVNPRVPFESSRLPSMCST